MKALILSAGFGTRLLPHTKILPKPLFPISGTPILSQIIEMLQDEGFTEIMVNTHHLHTQIEDFLKNRQYKSSVFTRYEPYILETGGAVKNLSDFWGQDPFLVINCDIFTDIKLGAVYNYHLSHDDPVTMVMHDYEAFNTVKVNNQGCIENFRNEKMSSRGLLAFTGIHVLDPIVLDYIPEKKPVSIINTYQDMLKDGHNIKSYFMENHFWADIGKPESYKEIASEQMAKDAFNLVSNPSENQRISTHRLKGDGSDRIWSRITAGKNNLVMVDHGIREKNETSEIDSFIQIGNHLYHKGVNIPQIIVHDDFSGIVVLEDLGDIHLKDYVHSLNDPEKILSCYKKIIGMVIDFSINGFIDFSPSYTYQTESYDQNLILFSECRYFVDAFLIKYLGQTFTYSDFENDFIDLSEKALTHAFFGLMHRDMQSKNIMVKDGKFFFIDFQGARKGPLQYDITSLLIDPYVNLPLKIQEQLADYSAKKISETTDVDYDKFLSCYRYCQLTRNLQMLGAFGFLTRVKQKTHFEKYIPTAFNTLKRNLFNTSETEFPALKKMVDQISKKIY